ncbi:SDR family oxidoreductase [Micromonospora costi]|uniref:SDR family oxidoreductase n=1 Tax=Micromonospora costi TaxID=1530042 RepID=A0A3A9ZV20_9ACTN|nr:SDR family oxidoreductase [Micromonospora costi]RKN52073.1 SDR family oxidoreductase [Micromonospora costi]
MNLNGKTAIVTGGSRGIGRAVVRRLAREGARVVFSYRENKVAADALVGELDGVTAVRADQADPDSLDTLFAAAPDGLDILVNNAAVNPRVPVAEMTSEDFDRVLTVNTKYPLLAMRRAAEVMRDHGRIISISTLNTVRPAPGHALYGASKAALEHITAVAAHELGSRGITVNTVSPGATDTDMLRESNPPEALLQVPAMTALGRLGRPEDIADVVAFLAGPDGRWITGQNIRATGGLLV